VNVLIIGSNGQLGWELVRTCPDGITLFAVDYPDIDITGAGSVASVMDRYSPDWVVNAAAYTHVDGAEKDPDAAHAVNCRGAEHIAVQIQKRRARLVHISTDFVFKGDGCLPYTPLDRPDPVSVYGKTKLAGERAVMDMAGEATAIIRTAWLYSSHGSNFVKTMLDLMEKKAELKVVDDQIGTPTWANGLAMAVWAVVEKQLTGLYHWTDAGVASWYDFAVAIQEEALALKLISKQIPVSPIPTEKYPTPAKRPSYSVLSKQDLLDKTELPFMHWRCQLRQMLRELAE
jgi:dTDP-4-dehydrorhamnose reductase